MTGDTDEEGAGARPLPIPDGFATVAGPLVPEPPEQPAPVPAAGAPGAAVSDDDRNAYGLLLDRAAERGLLTPFEYERRLGEVASATSEDELRRIVTELPAFTVGPLSSTGRLRAGRPQKAGRESAAAARRRGSPGSPGTAGASGASGATRRPNPWILLVVLVVVLAVALVTLALLAHHFERTHGASSADRPVPALSAPRP